MSTISAINGPAPIAQPAWLRSAAKVISVVFHPLFIPIYIAAYLVYGHAYSFAALDDKQKLIRLVSIFVITAFFPAITVFLLWRLKFAQSIMLRTQKERIIPYVSSTIYFFWAFYVSKNIPGSSPYLTSLFLGIFLSTSAALMANNYFKISMHALGVAGGAAFMILTALHSAESMGHPVAIAPIVSVILYTNRLSAPDINQHEVMTALHERLERLDGVAPDRHVLDLKGELLLGKAAGGVVILEGDLRPGDA